MVVSVDYHSEVVKNRTQKHYDFRIIVSQRVVSHNVRFDICLDQIAKNFETYVRDYREVDFAMVG